MDNPTPGFCRVSAVALVAFLVAACGSVPERVELVLPAASSSVSVDLRDARSGEQIAGRRLETTRSGSIEFGDDQFTPSRVLLLRRKLEQHLGERLRGRTVILKEFEVSSNHFYSHDPGPIIVNPLGNAIEAATVDRNLRSKLVVVVDGVASEGAAWRTVKSGAIGEGLRAVVSESIDAVIAKLKSQLTM